MKRAFIRSIGSNLRGNPLDLAVETRASVPGRKLEIDRSFARLSGPLYCVCKSILREVMEEREVPRRVFDWGTRSGGRGVPRETGDNSGENADDGIAQEWDCCRRLAGMDIDVA